MPATYIFRCPKHKEFEVLLRFGDEVPQWTLCPRMTRKHDHEQCRAAPCEYACMLSSKRVLTPPSSVTVKGGTGARKGC
ncbi:hypothetical protein LCGC14_2708380 [marine sediment metagenome]|uniref:Uncharacterized protein n=1 Tax=marine sediment metagenome TaxID=412755 RepID=A0A0F9BMT7_9ZZZZ